MLLEISVFLILIIIALRFCSSKIYSANCSTMLVLGSGGHTAELLSYIGYFPPEYSPRIYVVASSDPFSEQKAVELENKRRTNDFFVEKIPRAREVGQSYFTSTLTTCYAIMVAFLLTLKYQPRLILCNGPGTCVPICLAGRLLHILMGGSKAVVFVESVCRTRSLSLSGIILYRMKLAHVVVQWPYLLEKYPEAIYLGLLS